MPQYGESIMKLQEPLRSIAIHILQDSGGQLQIGGWRSNQTQARLYYNYTHHIGGQAKAARPGHSHHETGNAIDIMGDQNLANQLATKYGLRRTVSGESWHYELGGGVPGPDGQRVSDPFTFDLGNAQALNPQDVLANRLHAVLRTIGMDGIGQSNGLLTTPSDSTMTPPELNLPDMSDLVGFQQAQNMRHAREQGRIGNMGTKSDPFSFYSSANPPASNSAGMLQQYAKSLFKQFGWDTGQLPALITLWNKESGWNPHAQNPHSTAYGIAQFLNGTWAGTGIQKTSDPAQQIQAGLHYIAARYGSPSQALAFHLRHNWY